MRLLLPLVLSIILLAPPASASEAASLPEVRLAPQSKLLRISVVPASGTHLAEDLPLMVRLEDGYFDFQTTVQDLPDKGAAKVLVPLFREKRIVAWTLKLEGAACTDDGTSCVPFHLEQVIDRSTDKLRGRHETQAGRLSRPKPPPPPGRVPRQAVAQGPKPILYDFFATWCPPCDRLRDEFLEHPDWAEFVSRYEVVSLDADDPESFEKKDLFRVGGYPTVILTSPSGTILARITGFPGAAEVARQLEAATAEDSTDGCERAQSEMRRAAARHEHEEAWVLLTSGCDEPLKQLAGNSQSLQAAFDLAKKLGHTDEAIRFGAHFAGVAADLGTAAWVANTTAGLLEGADRGDEGTALKELVTARILRAREEDLGPDAAIELANALWFQGQWEAGQKSAIHGDAALLVGTAILDREGVEPKDGQPIVPDAVLALSTRLQHHEGLVHDLIDLVASAGDHSSAGRLLGAMLTLEPEGFTWHYAKAGWLKSRGMLPEALPPARQALTFAYGDNKLRAARRVAELLGPGDEALAVIDDALSAPEPKQEHVRTWRYREALKTLRAEFAGTEAQPR